MPEANCSSKAKPRAENSSSCGLLGSASSYFFLALSQGQCISPFARPGGKPFLRACKDGLLCFVTGWA